MFKGGVKVGEITMKTAGKSMWFYIVEIFKLIIIIVSHLKLHTQITFFTQLEYWVLYLLRGCFYTQSTRPTINTNYKII